MHAGHCDAVISLSEIPTVCCSNRPYYVAYIHVTLAMHLLSPFLLNHVYAAEHAGSVVNIEQAVMGC